MELIEQKGYKETSLLFLRGGTMLQSNNDVEWTEDIRKGIAVALEAERRRHVNRLCDNFGGRNGSRKEF